MDILNNILSVKAPTGLWANIINWMEGGITNSIMIAKIQPDLDKINKTYANNANMRNQKTAELYKKNNYSVYGTCIGLVVYMVLSMTIFFTLFSTLNNMSAYKISQEFDVLNSTYLSVYETYYNSYETDKTNGLTAELSQEEYATGKAQESVVTKYGEIKNGFLWIKNIWRPDTGAKVTLSYNDFISTTKEDKNLITEEMYNKVMDPIQQEYNGWNGYFLLAIINGGLSLASMYLSEMVSASRAKKKGLTYVKTTNKTMMIIMPVVMALFTIFYNSAFGIYIVAGTFFSVLTSPIITLIVDKMFEKKAKKEQSKKPSYSR